jgi:hypothetical protein
MFGRNSRKILESLSQKPFFKVERDIFPVTNRNEKKKSELVGMRCDVHVLVVIIKAN